MSVIKSILRVGGAGLVSVAAFAADLDQTRQLVATLQSTAPLAERARACQQLAIVGTPAAIPALAALLSDDKLANYARDALEVMPDPAARAALRDALGSLQGNFLVGAINSVGQRRDGEAVDALSRIASGLTADAVGPALLALGRIATPAASRMLVQTLIAVSAETRAAAAEGCLLCAERRRADGDRAGAAELFERVRMAEVPLPLRLTATRGTLLTREAGDPGILLETLRSTDADMRDLALLTSRELRDPSIGATLTAELNRSAEPMQVLLIAALVDRREMVAVPALEKRAIDAAPAVRVAALKGLGLIARPESLPVLLRALAATNEAVTIESAAGSLARVPLPETDGFLLAALPKLPSETAGRVIRILGERGATVATPTLFKLARDSDGRISQAALRALGLLAAPADLPALIELSLSRSEEEARVLADRAIVTTTMKVLEPARRADAVLAAWRSTNDTSTQRQLLRPLGAIVRSMGGSDEALAVVRGALNANDDALRDEARTTLANWPVPAKTKAGKNAPRQ